MRRRPPLIVFFAITTALSTIAMSGLVAASITTVATSEYANLPRSTAELRTSIRRANLIVRAKIIAYKPPAFGDHVAMLEETTIPVETTYAGTIKPGETLTYECVCHQVEQPPSPADRVGHEVLLFLAYDKKFRTWSPTTQQTGLYFNPELEGRVKKMLGRKA